MTYSTLEQTGRATSAAASERHQESVVRIWRFGENKSRAINHKSRANRTYRPHTRTSTKNPPPRPKQPTRARHTRERSANDHRTEKNRQRMTNDSTQQTIWKILVYVTRGNENQFWKRTKNGHMGENPNQKT